MTKKIILINETDDETRVAIVEDSVLQEMLIEHRTIEQTKNNIYKGTVVQIQSSLQAAFVDFGNKKHGFLPSGEINASIYQRKGLHNNSPIQQKLKKGQPVLVQVTREAVDQKGAALTTNISLPGRFMVLMPNSNKGGVSKKIDDAEERERLKSFISAIDAEKHAVIIRTAGVGRDLVELKKDYTTLKKTWEEIHKTFKEQSKPSIILEEADVVTRTLRDYYTEEIEEIWVDNPETFQTALSFLKQVAPRRQKDLKLFISDRSLFSTYKIERQVEQLTSRDVKLESGGSIVIDQTEALVSIDVNSGKSNQEGDIDATALRTNLEAAKEIARQLRLRNLGGLIVVDFIDMDHDSARKKVEEELQNAMSRDKAQRKYNPISQFGLLEMSRQRLTVGISHTVESNCPVCNGKGRIPSLLASTNLILRSIREAASKGNLIQIEGVLPLELANHLLNERRQSITDLELEFGIDIILRGEPQMVVFNETHLKPTFEQKEKELESRSESTSQRESQKVDGDKKKPQHKEKHTGKKSESVDKTERPHEKRDASSVKKTAPAEVDTDGTEKKSGRSQTVSELPAVEAEAVIEKPAIAQKQRREKPKAQKKPAPITNGSIHPSCLFLDIQELDAKELGDATVAFENRLKGKPDNQPPLIINQKYLWKNQKNEAEKATTPPVEDKSTGVQTPVPQEDPKTKAKKQPVPVKRTEDEAGDGNRKKDTRSSRKAPHKATASQPKTTGRKKPDSDQQKKTTGKKEPVDDDTASKKDAAPTKPQKKRQGGSRSQKSSRTVETKEKEAKKEKSAAKTEVKKPQADEKKATGKDKKPSTSSNRSRKPSAKKESLKPAQNERVKTEKKKETPARPKKRASRPTKEAKTPAD